MAAQKKKRARLGHFARDVPLAGQASMSLRLECIV
jgi:hypothetical protein